MRTRTETILVAGAAVATALALGGCSLKEDNPWKDASDSALYQRLSSTQDSDGEVCFQWSQHKTPVDASEATMTSLAQEINSRPEVDRQKIILPWFHFTGEVMPTDYNDIMNTLCQPIDDKDPMTWTDSNLWYDLSLIKSNYCQGFDTFKGEPYTWKDVADRINAMPSQARKELTWQKEPVSPNFNTFIANKNC